MAYIGKSPDGTGVRSRFYYTQTSGGGTSVTGSSDDGTSLAFSDGAYVDVFLNGVLLVAGTDYNTTTTNTIAGLAALASGDVVEVVVYDIFTVADTVSALNGGTFSGAVAFSGGINGDVAFDTNTLKVDSSNNRVGIGNSSPSHLLDATVSSGGASARFGTTHNSGDNDATVIITSGGSGDAMLRFDYEGSNTDRARLGTTSSGQDLKFFTAGNNERMRIDSSGGLLVGTTSASMTGLPDARFRSHSNGKTGIIVSEVFENGYGMVVQASSNTGSRFAMLFLNGGLGTAGSITQTQSAVAFNTSSDYRLKENVVDMTGAIARVKQLAPKRFNFIEDADNTVDGFLAHEAQTVVPEAITGTHNELDADDNPVYQGIDQSKLVPLLTGALKEAIAKIETLETKVAALEAGE